MRPFEELSGEWIGFWSQPPHRESTELHLRFEDGRISGRGTDAAGAFTVDGIYGGAAVRMAKRYETHHVTYHGHRRGDALVGLWRIRRFLFTDRGEFELRPRG